MHFLNFISLLVHVSPPCASLHCRASFTAASEFSWARVVLAVRHRPHEDVVGLEWCMGMPPLVLFLKFTSLLGYVSHHALPSLVMLPSPQVVSSVGQGLCWSCTGRMRTVWVWSGAWECPPVHFLHFISVLVYVFPPCASLPCHASCGPAGHRLLPPPGPPSPWPNPCPGWREAPLLLIFLVLLARPELSVSRVNLSTSHASFAAAGEVGWARVVLVVHAPAA